MPTTRHCLLIVDDEPDVCDSVHDLLRREFRVLKANSAEEGYRIMQEEEVHIVMSDQRMPQITGVELLTKLKARHPHAIRMLFTGFADLESIIAAINQGHIYPVHEEALAAGGAARGRAAGGARVRSARDHGHGARAPPARKSAELKQRVSALETEVRQLRSPESACSGESGRPDIAPCSGGMIVSDGRRPIAGRQRARLHRRLFTDGSLEGRSAACDRLEPSVIGWETRPWSQSTGANGMERRRHTLLVVDDEVDVLESLRHQFHRTYRVLTWPRARRPIELLENNDVELILSDQRMPGMSGDLLLREARRAQARRDPHALHRLCRHPGGHQRRQRRAHLPLHPQAVGHASSSKGSSARGSSSTTSWPSVAG